MTSAGKGRCRICESLSPAQLLELDTLIADPLHWPSTIWGLFTPPKGGLPASYRRFGAQRVASDWLEARGFDDIQTGAIRHHVRYDVQHVTRDPAEIVATGLIAASRTQTRIPTNPGLDTGAYIRYFNAGIQMGESAMTLMAERINRLLDEGKPVPDALVMKLADMGAQFAKTQAALVAKGLKMSEDEDEDDAFRGKDTPSPRVGHTRVRTIDGEARAVHDEGPADRARYNERARQEGRDEI